MVQRGSTKCLWRGACQGKFGGATSKRVLNNESAILFCASIASALERLTSLLATPYKTGGGGTTQVFARGYGLLDVVARKDDRKGAVDSKAIGDLERVDQNSSGVSHNLHESVDVLRLVS